MYSSTTMNSKQHANRKRIIKTVCILTQEEQGDWQIKLQDTLQCLMVFLVTLTLQSHWVNLRPQNILRYTKLAAAFCYTLHIIRCVMECCMSLYGTILSYWFSLQVFILKDIRCHKKKIHELNLCTLIVILLMKTKLKLYIQAVK